MSAPIPAPPPGGDMNRGPAINAAVWTFTTIALLCVLLRLYGRFILTNNFGWDDFWIVISMVLSLLYSCFASVYVHMGGGRHPYYLGLDRTAAAVRIISIGNIPGIISVAVPKLAVAVLLVRLLNPARYQKAILYTLTLSCVVIQTLCAVFLWVQCTPSAGLWNPVKYKPKCWDLSVTINYFIFSGSYSVFVDFYLAIYPMTVLWGLQINRSKKIGLSCVLGLGCIAALVGIYKCTTLPELRHGTDYTWATEGIEIMSSVEATVIIIAACLPTLRPVFLHFTGRSSTTNDSLTANPSKRARDYQLHSYGPDSKGSRNNGGGNKFLAGSKGSRKKGGDPYEINSQVSNYDVENEGEADSMEDRILPPSYGRKGSVPGMGGITKTFDVEVNHDGRVSQQGNTGLGNSMPSHGAPAQRGVTSQEWDRGARGVYSPRPYDGTAV